MNPYLGADPDDARELIHEDEHDERYGTDYVTDPAGAEAIKAKFRARFIEMTTGMVTT